MTCLGNKNSASLKSIWHQNGWFLVLHKNLISFSHGMTLLFGWCHLGHSGGEHNVNIMEKKIIKLFKLIKLFPTIGVSIFYNLCLIMLM